MRPASFQGPIAGKFDVLAELGSGAFGAVYDVIDRERNERVALKVLRCLDGTSLLRFKREFRALADIHHPNLVSLGELLEVNGLWMFTMELLRGRTFDAMLSSGAFSEGGASIELLVHLIRQIARGLSALHAAGFVHRDVKPSNMMVTDQGRLVLLDFGLLLDTLDRESGSGLIVGTPAYIAPEVTSGSRGTAASDWYAVGVSIYEAMSGSAPFEGSSMSVLLSKVQHPAPPIEAAHRFPKGLVDLCMALLERDPEKRASGADVLAALRNLDGLPAMNANAGSPHPAGTVRAPFVGRAQERAVLAKAVDHVSFGSPAVVYVAGESGIGKTALIQEELIRLREQPDCFVLQGRCYERETLAFKAIDGLMDDLARKLSEQSALAEQLRGPGVDCLLALFPTLRLVPGFVHLPQSLPKDPVELRSRAFEALRWLLRRLGEERLLILFIDDLQWSDGESLLVLEELLRAQEPPALCLVLAGRNMSEVPVEVAASVGRLLDLVSFGRRLSLGPLTPEEAHDLTLSYLSGSSARLVERVVHEAGGHPLFIDELVRHLSGERADEPASADLDTALSARVRTLSAEGRAVLLCLALSDKPVPEQLLSATGLIEGSSLNAALLELRGAKLLRRSSRDSVEIYHDRIRLAVLRASGAREVHAASTALGRALERVAPEERHAIALHYDRAGLLVEAGRAYLAAARHEAERGAHERAVGLYRAAMRCDPECLLAAHAQAFFGDALAQTGRCADAAEQYLAAAQSAEGPLLAHHRMRAAVLLLQAGHFVRGTALAKELCAEVSVRWPGSAPEIVATLVYHHTAADLRLRFAAPAPRPFEVRESAENEMLYGVATALQGTDTLRGAALIAQYASRVLGRGDPFEELRALAQLAIMSANAAPPFARSQRFLQRAQKLVEISGNPRAEGYYQLGVCGAGFFAARYAESLAAALHAERVFLDHGAGASWELTTTRTLTMFGLIYAGRWKELPELGRRYSREASERGDLFGQITFPLLTFDFEHMLSDDPEEGERELSEVLARWHVEGFHTPQLYALLGRYRLALYSQRPDKALALHENEWPRFRRSHFYYTYVSRGTFLYLHLGALLNRALECQGTEKKALLRRANTVRRQLLAVRRPFADVYARVGLAAMAHLQGDLEEAVLQLRQALSLARAAPLESLIPAFQMRLSQLVGGDEGLQLRREADAWTAAQGFRKVTGFYHLICPGFAGP